MGDLFFELLKVRLQRNIRLLEEFRKDQSISDETTALSDSCNLLEQWIRSYEATVAVAEKAESNLKEMVSLYQSIRRTWRWKIGIGVMGFVETLLLRKKSGSNAFTRMDELIAGVDKSMQDKDLPLDPFRFSALSKQFVEPVAFPPVQMPRKGQVAIIVLNRNGEEHLEKLFSSFIAFNSYQDYEFIVIDHDSDDKSMEIIASYKQKINIRLIPFSLNLTYSYSNNYAAGQTDAEFLFLLNNDIIFDQDVIGSLVKLMKQHPEAGIVAPSLFYPDNKFHRSGTLQHSGIRFIYKQKRDDHIRYSETDPPSFYVLKYKYSHLFRDAIIPVNSLEPATGITFHPAICAAAMLCRRDDYLLAGGFDENYIYGYEDVDLSLVFQKKLGKKLILANDLGMIHNESYTRKKEGLYKASLKIHNLLMLTHHFGYYIRINYLRDLFSGKRFWTDQHPVVAIISGNDKPKDGNTPDKVKFLSVLFNQILKWEVRVISSSELAIGTGDADIAIYLGSGLPVEHRSGARDTMISIFWPDEGKPTFSFEKAYGKIYKDILSLEPGQELIIKSLDYPDPDPFREFILHCLDNYFKIAVKSPFEAGNPDAGRDGSLFTQSVEGLLADDQCIVRTDLPGHWYDYGTLTDHVVISFPGDRIYYPQPGQINVLWLTKDRWEADLSLADFYDLIIIDDGIENHPLQGAEGPYSKKIMRSAFFNILSRKNTTIDELQELLSEQWVRDEKKLINKSFKAIHHEKAGI